MWYSAVGSIITLLLSGCSPLRLGANGLISYCFFAFFDVQAIVFS